MESEGDGECKFVHFPTFFSVLFVLFLLCKRTGNVLCRKQTVGLIVESGILF